MFIGARISVNRRRNNVIESFQNWSLTPFASASPFYYTIVSNAPSIGSNREIIQEVASPCINHLVQCRSSEEETLSQNKTLE